MYLTGLKDDYEHDGRVISEPTRHCLGWSGSGTGLAGKLKAELEAAAFNDTPVPGAFGQTAACQAVIASAQHLAAAS